MVFIFPMPSQVILTLPANTSEECQEFLNAGDALWIRKAQALPQQFMKLIINLINRYDKCLNLFTGLWEHRWGTPNLLWDSFISAPSPPACRPPSPPEVVEPLLVFLEPLYTNLCHRTEQIIRIIPSTWLGLWDSLPVCIASFISEEKTRNRLLFAVPSVRLVETWSLPKIGGVIICGEHWVPEQV